MVEKKRILLIDDEEEFCFLMKRNLERSGEFEVFDCFSEGEFRRREFSNTNSLFRILSKRRPDVIILDLILPGMDGFKICKSIRERKIFSSMSIIILSGKGAEFDKVSGLNMGADDYMVKPFSVDELGARIRAVLRRQRHEVKEEKKINVGNALVIDLQRHQVLVGGKKVELTYVEFMILELLSSKKGQVFSRAQILDYLWGSSKGVTERTVDVHIRHLRSKLGASGEAIRNIRSIGYKLEEDI